MTKKLINYSGPKVLWFLRLFLVFSLILAPQFMFLHKASAAVTASDDFNRADGGSGAELDCLSLMGGWRSPPSR